VIGRFHYRAHFRCRFAGGGPHAQHRSFVGREPVQAFHRADPQLSAMIEGQGPYRHVRPHPLHAATRAYPIEPGAGAIPDLAVATGHQRLPRRVAQGSRIQRDHPVARAGFRIQPFQARQRADPDLAGMRQQCFHFALRLLAAGHVVMADFARGEVEAGYVLGIGAHPQRMVAFGRQCRDVTIGKARRIARIVPVLHVALAVVAVQAALGRDPDETLRVLRERVHGVLAETALAAEPGEVIIARQRSGIGRHACDEQACDHCDQAGSR
jgi:hypothetical protein